MTANKHEHVPERLQAGSTVAVHEHPQAASTATIHEHPQAPLSPAPHANVHEHPQLGDDTHAHTHAAHAHTVPHEGHGKPTLIEIRDFCFRYEEAPTLNHIDLDIHAGDCAILMGPNGCGKSTLLKVINGLIFPERGTYKFAGENVSRETMKNAQFAKSLHQRVGFIFQDSDAQLFCSTVEDELAFGPRQMGLDQQEVKRRIEDVSALLGIEKLLARAPYHLSGGEKKKVAIACILTMNPDVFCFDEPLNGLDIATREHLLGVLRQLKDAGKTLIIATHDISLADALADYYIFMGEHHDMEGRRHVHINQVD